MKVQSYSQTTDFSASGSDLHMRKPFHCIDESSTLDPSTRGQVNSANTVTMFDIYRYSYEPMDWNVLIFSQMVVHAVLFI